MQRRVNPQELDNEALAFKPVLGSMLGRIYHNPHNKEENQSRLQKVLQFWASKEVFDQETVFGLENEMMSGHTDASALAGDRSSAPGSFTETTCLLLRKISNKSLMKVLGFLSAHSYCLKMLWLMFSEHTSTTPSSLIVSLSNRNASGGKP